MFLLFFRITNFYYFCQDLFNKTRRHIVKTAGTNLKFSCPSQSMSTEFARFLTKPTLILALILRRFLHLETITPNSEF